MTDWFRSWHGAPTDIKWLVIGRMAGVKRGVVAAIWHALEDYASQHVKRGTVAGFDVETYAEFSEFSIAEIEAVIAALTEKGTIVDGRLAAWDKRQPRREDDNAPRTGRQRLASVAMREVREVRDTQSTPHVPQNPARVEESRGSEATASAPAVAAPSDERTKLFQKGLATVVEITGRPEPKARRLIGGWLRDANDDCLKLNRLIEDAALHRPADVVAFVEGALKIRAPPAREGFGTIALELERQIDERDREGAAAADQPDSGASAGRDAERVGDGRGRGSALAGQGTQPRNAPHGGGEVVDLVAESRRAG
jgi:hypothetical protein